MASKQAKHQAAAATAAPKVTQEAGAAPAHGGMIPKVAGPTASQQAFDGDSMNETEQMKLQQQMEKQSKINETASNMMHSMSETEKTITDNVK